MSVTPPPLPPPHPPTEPHRGTTLPARCSQCFYVIENLSDRRCPECGKPFDLANPATFTREPPAIFIYWHWGLALLLAGAVAAATSFVLVLAGNWGAAIWIGVPMGSAVILGYAVRPSTFAWILGIIALGVIIIATFIAMQIAGLFCGLILAWIIVVPLSVGCLLGALLRVSLKHNAQARASKASLVIALSIPLGWGVIEGRPVPMANETITTSRIINAPVQRAWDSMMFYEEVEHRPPLILRIGLAHPLVTQGSSQRVNDIKTCYYNTGHITKQVAAVDKHERLAFAVIEQDIGYERDVHLTGGSFAFEAIDDGTTRVTLTTRYEPLLSPRFLWRWGENYAVHTLHDHVLEGMARKAEGRPALPTADAVALGRNDAIDD